MCFRSVCVCVRALADSLLAIASHSEFDLSHGSLVIAMRKSFRLSPCWREKILKQLQQQQHQQKIVCHHQTSDLLVDRKGKVSVVMLLPLLLRSTLNKYQSTVLSINLLFFCIVFSFYYYPLLQYKVIQYKIIQYKEKEKYKYLPVEIIS